MILIWPVKYCTNSYRKVVLENEKKNREHLYNNILIDSIKLLVIGSGNVETESQSIQIRTCNTNLVTRTINKIYGSNTITQTHTHRKSISFKYCLLYRETENIEVNRCNANNRIFN